MPAICGADCKACPYGNDCPGCEATCGKPFGGTCVAAAYIRTGGMKAYAAFKQILLKEVNALLRANHLPEADSLQELPGSFINLAYPLPSGRKVQLLNDNNVYLGTQIAFADLGICYGVAADTTFILICSYSVNGSEPELLVYQKR